MSKSKGRGSIDEVNKGEESNGDSIVGALSDRSSLSNGCAITSSYTLWE